MSLILAGSPYSASSAETFISSFTLENTEASSTQVLARVGMPFKAGDVPSTSSLKIRRNSDDSEIEAYQFDQRVSWDSDGSLKFTVCHMRDETDITASQSRTYDIYEVSNSSFDNTGTFSLADVKTNSTWVVNLSDFYESVSDVTLASSSIDTTNTSATFTVNHTSHGMSEGDKVVFQRAFTVNNLVLAPSTGNGIAPRAFTVNASPNANDFTCDHPTDTANATGSGGSSRRMWRFQTGMNDHTLAFDDTETSSTYATKIHSGPVCDGWVVWQFANDDVTTNDDDQLIGVWYVDAWNDGSDTTNGNIECACKLTRPQWAVTGKCAAVYTATFKEGATTKDTYTDVYHAAHTEWVTLRDDADNHAARRHWQTDSQRPTLVYKPSIAYWNTTGVVPSYIETNGTYPPAVSSGYTSYAPGAAYSHFQNLSDTGGYYGRGPITRGDAAAYMRVCNGANTEASDLVEARVQATAAFHAPIHFRTSTNTLIPLWLDSPDNGTTGSTDYNADGLPNRQYAYASSGGAAAGGYVTPTGGDPLGYIGTWSYGDSDSHGTPYNTFMYTWEGEPYMYDAMLDLGMCVINRKDGSGTAGGKDTLLYYSDGGSNERRTEYSIASSTYDSVVMSGIQNIRYVGLSHCMLAGMWGLRADADKHKTYIDDIRGVWSEWLGDVLAYLPSAMTTRGLLWENSATASRKGEPNFQHALISYGILRVAAITADANYISAANVTVKFGQSLAAQSCYLFNGTSISFSYKGDDAAPDVNGTYMSGPRYSYAYSAYGNITEADDKITWDNFAGAAWVLNDTMYFENDPDDGTVNIPSEVSEGTEYYIVSPNSTTDFKASTTSSGSAIDFGTDQKVSPLVDFSNIDVSTDGAGGLTAITQGNEYFEMHWGVQKWAASLGIAGADASIVTKMTTFANSPTWNDASFSAWMLEDVS